MKTRNLSKNLALLMLLMVIAGILFVSCDQEPEDVGPNGGTTNPDKVMSDPEGTVILSMRDFDNGNIRIDDKIYINKENWTGEGCSFVSVGEMKGLGNIESIPTTGWAKQMGVYPSNGYVAYNQNMDTYYRIYVTEYLYNTSEEIIGAKVKYQKPFAGRDEALKTDTKSLSFKADGGTEKVFFKNTSIVPFTVTNSQSWCRVQRVASSDNAFLYDGISVTTLASGLPTMSYDTITVETLFGKQIKIEVQREGNAYLQASADTLAFTAYSGSKTVSLNTNMEWQAYASASWIELSSASGKGNFTVKITVSANSSGSSRTGVVKFVSDNKSASVTVVQAGGSISVTPSTLEIKDSGETKVLKLVTPFTWTAAVSDTWLKITPESGSGDATLTLAIEANSNSSTRTGTITFISSDSSESVVVTQKGGSLSVSPSSLNFSDTGETKPLKLQTSNEQLLWTASTNESWIKLSSESGNGSTTLSVTTEANNSTSERTGNIIITSGETTIPVAVTQYSGSLTVSSSSLDFIDAGETKPLKITTTTSLPWTASSNSTWIKITPESGNGSATLSVTAEANNGTSERKGKITIISGEKTTTIDATQFGGSFSVSKPSLEFKDAAETQTVELKVSNPMLSWTATTSDSWFKVSPESGNGSATVTITTEDNGSTSERTGRFIINSGGVSIPITIFQNGGSLSVSASSLNYIDIGESKSLKVKTSNPSLVWMSKVNESWLKVSAESGRGDAVLMITAESNDNTSDRFGTVVLSSGGQTVSTNIIQAGGKLSASPTSVSLVPENGGSYPIELLTSTHFSWKASSNSSWITISPIEGSGSKTITMSVKPNESHFGRSGIVEFSSGEAKVSVVVSQQGINGSKDWADLGLPSGTLWGTKNIGASAPEDYGTYYAWGEILPKNQYSWDSYTFCSNANLKLLTKYNCDKSDGVVDNLTTLLSEDDAAYQLIGGKTPTQANWKELLEQCTWNWVTMNNVSGYIVTGKNGNTIFLPAAGDKNEQGNLNNNQKGFYWSSSLNETYATKAWSLVFSSSNKEINAQFRYLGFSIRPVLKP